MYLIHLLLLVLCLAHNTPMHVQPELENLETKIALSVFRDLVTITYVVITRPIPGSPTACRHIT